jgi:hypothetical protein
MTDENDWLIDIPTQGIKVRGKQDILKFFSDEIVFFKNLGPSQFSVEFLGNNYGAVTLDAIQELTKITDEMKKDKVAALRQYIEDASAYAVLVGASPMGKRIAMMKSRDANAALLTASILAPKWLAINSGASLAGQIIVLFRALAFANPANFGFDNLISASQATRASEEARDASRASAQKLEEFIAEKTALFGKLEDFYRKQLTLQEPAVSWEEIARRKTRVWGTWLFVFALMVIAPIVAALISWEQVSNAVTKVTSAPSGGFSISGLAVITVPALFYAWLLKNISRVFIQNLNLADDAAHRRSLALTYMGLLQDEKHPASDQDRAIILNALFRPIPPQTNDEGPPAGLIDLIQKK